jgi:phospholipid/cholesterol/gamma-HCH transport system substrate-binding protein/paraquat-inducible protein B
MLRDTNRKFSRFLKEIEGTSIVSDVSAATATVRRIAEGAEKPLNQLVTDLAETSKRVKELAAKLEPLSDDLPETVALMKRTLRRLDYLVSSRQQDIDVTLENIKLISEHLKELTDNAKKYPAQILFGKPPPPSDSAGQP